MGVYLRKVKDADTGKYVPGKIWYIGFYFQGQRYRYPIGPRKKDAEDTFVRIKADIAMGKFVGLDERQQQESIAMQQQPALFETFTKEEFLPWSESQHSPRHYTRLESMLRVHLNPYFGEYLLSEITAKLVEDYKGVRRRTKYRRGRQAKSVNPATINRELCCLKIVLRKAVEWGRIDRSPAQGIKGFKETPKKPRLPEREEIVRLLNELPEHFKALVACIVYAGLRRSELFHLRWEDVHLEIGELEVVSREEHPTKNNETRRIPIGAALDEILRRHHGNHRGGPLVFSNRDGKVYTDIREPLDLAAQRAGIEGGIKLHQLRHCFCSHALMQGIDARTVQKWMGHKDLKTTLRYAHVSPSHEKESIEHLKYQDGPHWSQNPIIRERKAS